MLCKLCPPSVGHRANSIHHLPSTVQATSTVPLLFLPRSLSFPLTNHGRIFNCMSPIYNPPPTLVIAATSRSNHRSRRPKPPAQYRFSRSCHHCYPSLSLKPSLSTSLTTGVLSEEGGQFFCFDFFVSLCLYIEIFWNNICLDLGRCEKPDKNVFSRAFLRIQPNTRKYFSKHFLECNQTLENIFFSRKYFHLKIFYTGKIFYIETNAALASIFRQLR